jgi:hypothetical protein
MNQAETQHLFFFFASQAKNLKTNCACAESTDLILKALKNGRLMTQSL